jgi:putative DNA primase/helicase
MTENSERNQSKPWQFQRGQSGNPRAFDRIIRGRTHIEAACLSLVGSTQPGRLAGYIRQANIGGASDDGLIQRFGLLVWPDQSPEWQNVDRPPNSDARAAAWQVFERLGKLQPAEAGAEYDPFEPVPFLRFDESAQILFNEWRGAHEIKLRSGELPPALESHLAKYRKLVPAFALINHLTDGGSGPIGETVLLRALALAEYLETHAKRAYAAGSEFEISAAKAILRHIRNGDLQDGFTARDIQRKDWANLSDRANMHSGLDLLCDLDWLRAEKRETGGRPSVSYRINPKAKQ